MKFGIEDKQLVINHIMLGQSKETINKIADTYKNSKELPEKERFELKVLINNVEVEFANTFEKFMKNQYDYMVSVLEEQYDVKRFDARVKEEAEKLIRDKFEDLREKMYEFENCLDFGIDDMHK